MKPNGDNHKLTTVTMSSSTTREPLRIQIVSDLHLEFYEKPERIPKDIIQPRAPVLALLGDIGLACTPLLRSFLHMQSEQFEKVLYVAGNHEFYNICTDEGTSHTVSTQLTWIQKVCNERDNLYFLEKKGLIINGVRILGTTLWSYIPPSAKDSALRMNDYWLSYTQHSDDEKKEPLRMTVEYTNRWHQDSLAWLERKIENANAVGQPVLVLTHHTPSLSGTSDPRYEGSDSSRCFSSNLTRLLQAPVVAWACGHTHYNFDMRCGKNNLTRLVSNQRGYPGKEKMDYDDEGLVLVI